MLLNTIQKTILTRSNSRLPQSHRRDNSKSLRCHPCFDTVFASIKPKKCSKKNQNIKRPPSQPSFVYFECNKAIPSEELLTMLNKVIAIL